MCYAETSESSNDQPRDCRRGDPSAGTAWYRRSAQHGESRRGQQGGITPRRKSEKRRVLGPYDLGGRWRLVIVAPESGRVVRDFASEERVRSQWCRCSHRGTADRICGTGFGSTPADLQQGRVLNVIQGG